MRGVAKVEVQIIVETDNPCDAKSPDEYCVVSDLKSGGSPILAGVSDDREMAFTYRTGSGGWTNDYCYDCHIYCLLQLLKEGHLDD